MGVDLSSDLSVHPTSTDEAGIHHLVTHGHGHGRLSGRLNPLKFGRDTAWRDGANNASGYYGSRASVR